MRLPSVKKAFILLALLLCQLTAFAHVAQHAALEQDQSCQICLHAPGTHAGATAPALVVLSFTARHEAPQKLVVAAAVAVGLRHYPIRAPPVLTVV